MKSMLFIVSVIFALQTNAQNLMQSADTIKAANAVYENIYSRALYSDTNIVSSFVIFIKKEVKAHKHISTCRTCYCVRRKS
jgi:hypothetical protein